MKVVKDKKKLQQTKKKSRKVTVRETAIYFEGEQKQRPFEMKIRCGSAFRIGSSQVPRVKK